MWDKIFFFENVLQKLCIQKLDIIIWSVTNHIIFTVWKVSKYGVFSGSYFPLFGLNMEIQSEYRKIRTRKNSVFGKFSCSACLCNKNKTKKKWKDNADDANRKVPIIFDCWDCYGHSWKPHQNSMSPWTY